MEIKIVLLIALVLSVASACGQYSYSFGCYQNNNQQGTSVYLQIDDLTHQDYHYIQNAHQVLKRALTGYFIYRSYGKYQLYNSAIKYVKALKYIEEKYLGDDNNIVIGNNNAVKGENNVLKGDNHSLVGNGNYILNGRFSHIDIRGNNIVRIGRFDFDMDQVEKIKICPCKAITVLSQSGNSATRWNRFSCQKRRRY